MLLLRNKRALNFSNGGNALAVFASMLFVVAGCAMIWFTVFNEPQIAEIVYTGGNLASGPLIFPERPRDTSRDSVTALAGVVGLIMGLLLGARALFRLFSNRPALAILGDKIEVHPSFITVQRSIPIADIVSASVMTVADAKTDRDRFFDAFAPLGAKFSMKKMQKKKVLIVTYKREGNEKSSLKLPSQFIAGGDDALSVFCNELNADIKLRARYAASSSHAT